MAITVSLLGPAGGSAQGCSTLPDSVVLDLGLAELVRAIASRTASASGSSRICCVTEG